MTPSVTIVVVSWNTRELLLECVRSIDRNLARVVVVDNASADGSADAVRERFPWAELIASPENLGFGPAVNLGLRDARTPWVGISNADIELRPGALEALLDAGWRDPRAGLIAPKLILPDGSTQHSVHAFPMLLPTALLNLSVERWSPAVADRLCVTGHWDERRRRRVPWAHGAFLLARREAWRSIGGFDEKQWMYAEDIDIAWRMRRQGWLTRYEPTALVGHAESAAARQAWGDARAARSMRASYEWLARRRGSAYARGVAAINLAGTGTRRAAHAAAAKATGSARHAAERDRWRWHMRLHRAPA
jgi:GT2 family glycosyltransferase